MQAVNLQIEGYIMKPAKLEQLVKAFSSCVKKMANTNEITIKFDDQVIYNLSTNELYKNKNKISLTKKEYALLKLLCKEYPNITTKEEIAQTIWPMDEIGGTTIKNVIARLRLKIGHRHIVAIPGIGWRIILENNCLGNIDV